MIKPTDTPPPARPDRRDPPGGTLTDEQVVARVCRGERGLFEVIMRRHNQRLFRAARAVLRNDSEAEDAVQQAYLSAFTHLGQFAGEARFSTWLTRIALNEAFARRRQAARESPADIDEQWEPRERPGGSGGPPPTPEEQLSRREVSRLLETAIDELPANYRVVVMLREVQELSTAETAACLELSEEAVKVRLHRARARLRDTLPPGLGETARETFAFLGERCDRIVAYVMAHLP